LSTRRTSLFERRTRSSTSRSIEHRPRRVQLEFVELRAVSLDPSSDAHVGANHAGRGEGASEGDGLDVGGAVDVGGEELETVVS
jgi:hypothetical protein